MAMASVTRATRRTDGLRHPHQHMEHRVATSTRSHHHNINHHHPNTARTKRYLGGPDREFEALQHKKRRISVEIPSRLPIQPKHGHVPQPATAVVTTVANPHPANRPNSAPVPAPAPTPTPAPDPAAAPSQLPLATFPASGASTVSTAGPANPQSLTKHKEKVVNGLKHELDRLKPGETDTNTKEPGRKLRSQEATRFKSDLSAYFPDYDEVIGNDPKEQHLLNLDTPILVSDPNPIPTHTAASSKPSGAVPLHRSLDSYQTRGYGDALFTDLFDSQQIDFGFLEARYNGEPLPDPLPDSYFEPSHRKAERLERSIRNSEKGRAQHERDQIARLLEGLQGHDWLRVMGVSGITETKKRAFEPARGHFIRGCQAILDKFRAWAAEEKRRKLEKERAIAEADAEDEVNGADDGDEERGRETRSGGSEEAPSARGGNDADSAGDAPDYSDVDVEAARQLREEAMAAAKSRSKRAGSGLPTAGPAAAAPEPLKEFTSFFRKKYQRDAALSKSRRRGRTVMAWGHAVPEVAEVDFELPVELRDEETLKSQARRKRRDKRGKGPRIT